MLQNDGQDESASGSIRRRRSLHRAALHRPPPRAVWATALGLAILLLSGCLEKRMQWSPDGERLALYTAKSLFLSDPEGRLTHQLQVPRVHGVAWMGDSQRLVIAAVSEANQPGLAMLRIEGEELAMGLPFYTGSPVADIRVAPGDRNVAFTAEGSQGDEFELLVAPCDGSAPASAVSRRAAAYPDWTPDGRALVYLEAAARPESAWDELRLGALVQRDVADAAGRIGIAEEPRHLASVMFAPYARTRCLRDGRVMFTAAEFKLPSATGDVGGHREQLFAVAAGRQPTLVRMIPRRWERSLPQHLSFFEVSPDESQVLFGTEHGDVYVLALAAGDVYTVQTAATDDSKEKLQGAPVWRTNGDLTYIRRRSPGDDPALRPAEVVLRHGSKETVLSSSWPDEMLEDLVEWEH